MRLLTYQPLNIMMAVLYMPTYHVCFLPTRNIMTTSSPAMKISRGTQPHCQTCALNALCLPLSLNDNDMDKLDDIIRRGRPIQKGTILFQQG
jgi:hypothetical protein